MTTTVSGGSDKGLGVIKMARQGEMLQRPKMGGFHDRRCKGHMQSTGYVTVAGAKRLNSPSINATCRSARRDWYGAWGTDKRKLGESRFGRHLRSQEARGD